MVDYPSPSMELAILQLNAGGEQLPPPPVTLSQAALLSARSAVQAVQMQTRLEHYLVQLVYELISRGVRGILALRHQMQPAPQRI